MDQNLHAFPDHEVMQACLQGVEQRRLSKKEALRKIEETAGWLPVAIEPEKQLMYFANVEDRNLDRWQFVYSINAFANDGSSLDSFSVELDLLDELG